MGKESRQTPDQAEQNRRNEKRIFRLMEQVGYPRFAGLPVAAGGALLGNDTAVVIGVTFFAVGTSARVVGTVMIDKYRREDFERLRKQSEAGDK